MIDAFEAHLLEPWLVAAAGACGLLVGSFLNVVVWRVPRGESLLKGSHCLKCDAPICAWQNVPVISWLLLGGRCARCGARISARYPLVDLGTAAVFALVTWWVTRAFGWPGGAFGGHYALGTSEYGAGGVAAWWLILAAYLTFAAVSICLALIDLDHQRLPDVIVLPSLLVITAMLALGAVLIVDWPRFITTLAGAIALFALYLLIALVYPRGIGGGDVKLAPLLGAVLAFVGWGSLVVGAFAGFVLGAVVGLTLIALRRATRKSSLPFGPFMLLGAWIGVISGPQITDAYLAFVIMP